MSPHDLVLATILDEWQRKNKFIRPQSDRPGDHWSLGNKGVIPSWLALNSLWLLQLHVTCLPTLTNHSVVSRETVKVRHKLEIDWMVLHQVRYCRKLLSSVSMTSSEKDQEISGFSLSTNFTVMLFKKSVTI